MSEKHQYLLPEPEKEVARLTEQDSIILHMMDGKRILAPIDLKQQGLRILDSATADGLFLRDIQPLLTEPYILSGYDVMESFFPPTSPPHTSFSFHDISQRWPDELHGSWDLVHQRFAIPGGAKKATPRQIVSYLCQLVKPGGWIQLGEMDVRDGPVRGGPAMQDTWTCLRAWMTAAGAGAEFANELADWIKEEGFTNVKEEHVEIAMGPHCEDLQWGARSAQVMLNAVTGVSGACKNNNFDVPASVLDRLPERAADEFFKKGGTYRIIFAIGQKPPAYKAGKVLSVHHCMKALRMASAVYGIETEPVERWKSGDKVVVTLKVPT